MVLNLLAGREPLYGLGEWAARYEPATLGLVHGRRSSDQRRPGGPGAGAAVRRRPGQPAHRADPRGDHRVRDRHRRAAQRLHLDHACPGSTGDATGTPRGGKPTPVVTFGHSKDHRPDLKQLVWILTVAADGAVPIAYRLADGNTTDDPTHVPTWDGLVGAARAGRLPLRRGLQAVLARGDGPHRHRRRPVRHRAAPHPVRGPLVPRLDPNPPATVDRGAAATRRPPRRTRPGVLDLPRAAALRRGLPDHLGALHRQGRPRRGVPLGPHRGRHRRDRGPGRPPGRPEVPAQDPGGRHRGRHRARSMRPGPAAGSASPSARPSRRASAKNAAADPVRTPATAATPAPDTRSAGNSTRAASPTTPPPTAASR